MAKKISHQALARRTGRNEWKSYTIPPSNRPKSSLTPEQAVERERRIRLEQFAEERRLEAELCNVWEN